MKTVHKKAHGFTLVELLVVIAIIAALASFATPLVLKQLKKAQIVKATAVCSALESAVDSFQNEYNYLPYSGESSPTSDDEGKTTSEGSIITVLAGKEDKINFKEIKFFEQDTPNGSSPDSYKDGMHVTADSAALYDPWGKNPNTAGSGVYHLVLDYDMDGVIQNPYDAAKEVAGKSVIIYSYGPDQMMETGTSAGKNNDNPGNF